MNKRFFFYLGLGLQLALTLEDFSGFWIPRSSVKLNFRIGPWIPQNNFCCFFFSDRDTILYPRNAHVFFHHTHFRIFGSSGPNFFQNPNSFALPNFKVCVMIAGVHPAQILRSQHMIEPGNIACHVKLTFSTKRCFFRFDPFL